MLLEQNKAIVIKMYRAFDRQDVEQGQKFMATDIVGHGMYGITRQGVDSFIEYAMSMFSVFPDGCHQIDEIIAEGDKVVTRRIFCGTHQGELMDVPATGKRVRFSFVHIDHIVDGKVVKHWGQADVFSMMQQLQK
ncbi:ester cyclase [Pleurocapsa sp. PCC 7319]|uniref:ester cyclase n=1 Tax=Pleurocapsa sp. PCC 7319 TaxID=118161 RepID=UPI0003485DC4|nr:ester cyclase [Pleurocapsa sp. PCC 7319]